MYRFKIFLMLSTIIPSLDCCCSRTIFHRKSVNLYPDVELSMQKPSQFQQNDPQSLTVPASTLSSYDDETTLSYRFHHLDNDSDEESDEDEEEIKQNRSHRSDLQNQEALIERKLEEDFSSNPTAKPDVPEEDAQYKLMGEIVSIECLEWFRLEFCLNGGRCFLYPILNQSLTSCECAEGYVGERCEAKSFEFIPHIRPRFVLAKAIGGPLIFVLAVIDILLLLFLFCKNYNRD